MPQTVQSGVSPQEHGSPSEPLVRLRSVTKRFGAVVALDSVDLVLHRGEVLTITGENGSGKSTVARILGGLLLPDDGTVEIDGRPQRLGGARVANELGIAVISQELTLASELSVAENLFMGRLPGRGPAVAWKRLWADAAAVLTRYGIELDPRDRVGDLPIELQQQVEIARALSLEPRILILDEATSSLSEEAAERLLQVVEQQRDAGTAVVMITHRMGEIFRMAGRALVLRDGKRVGDVALCDVDETGLVRMMVGRELVDYYGHRDGEIGTDSRLQLRALTVGSELAPLDLDVRAGEIVGVAGLTGSGKETLGRALAGSCVAAGHVTVDGTRVRLGRGSTLPQGIGYVPEDRKVRGLLLDRSLVENFSVAWRQVFRRGVLRARHERELVDDAMGRYEVRPAITSLPIRSLSGGNQQKVVVGRLLHLGLPVYVMAEPTRGVDVGSKSAIYTLLRAQASTGSGVLFISSELNELCGLCDRVVVLHQGRCVAQLEGDDLHEEAVTHAMVTGTRPPTGDARTATPHPPQKAAS